MEIGVENFKVMSNEDLTPFPFCIYQQFTDRWFEREKQRLKYTQQLDLPKSAFSVFCEGLAFAMFMQGSAEVDYVPILPETSKPSSLKR